MAVKRKDFQKVSSTVQEFLLKLPDEESSARLRDNLLHALHCLQVYYRFLQNRDKNNDPLQWNVEHSLSPLTPFREAPDKFEWEWINLDSQKVRQSLSRSNNQETLRSLPPVVAAVRNGDIDLLKEIVDEDPNNVNRADSLSRDCVYYAVEFEYIDILKYLIKKNANLNNAARDGSIALHRAIYKGNKQIARLLLENGANANAQDNHSRSAVHWSIVNESTDCLKALIEFDANVNLKDKDGLTPAMWACHLDHVSHFKILKQNAGRNTIESETDNEGKTCLHWSVRKKEPLECLKSLLDAETVYVGDKDGRTCLHIAAEQGALEACKVIIDTAQRRDIVNCKDSNKQTPLHLASLNGHARAIKLLIENGADPYLKDSTGASPFDYVTKRGLFFCNSIFEICLKQEGKKSKKENDMSYSNLNASQELNITPAPPTTPKSVFSRSFQYPSPINTPPTNISRSGQFNTLPPRALSRSSSITNNNKSFDDVNNNNNDSTEIGNRESQKQKLQSPSFRNRLHNNINNQHNFNAETSYFTDRIPSASYRGSRASSRSSFYSEDLEKYMSNGAPQHKPAPPPRAPNSNASGRILLSRAQDTSSQLMHDNSVPPPVKPRRGAGSQQRYSSHDNEQPHLTLRERDRESHHLNNHQHHNSNTNMRVEDVSDDESASVTSTKGEGYASDFSDNEAKQRAKRKNKKNNFNSNSNEFNKRPTTPMDIRPDNSNNPNLRSRQAGANENIGSFLVNSASRTSKKQHTGDQQQQQHQRFNEWEPYGRGEAKGSHSASSERQKSPSKSHKSFTDSSPRQTSGRGQSSAQQDKSQSESTTSNIELMVSGKNISRQNSSPSNTPREAAPLRPPTRRLQPIERMSENLMASSDNDFGTISSPKQQRTSESHSGKSKSSKSNILDRKKLEPIKVPIQQQSSMAHYGNNYDQEQDHRQQHANSNMYMDDEQSVSENTISSDRQQQPQLLNAVRVQRNKTSAQNRANYGNKKRLIEPILDN